MKKLKLDVETLVVNSFETLSPRRDARATVVGHAAVGYHRLVQHTDPSDITCPSGCGGCGTADCTIDCSGVTVPI